MLTPLVPNVDGLTSARENMKIHCCERRFPACMVALPSTPQSLTREVSLQGHMGVGKAAHMYLLSATVAPESVSGEL